MKTRSYVMLDGLRGVAALCIVVLHCYRFFGDLTGTSAALAVDLFFMLSGFVLSHAYDERFGGGMGWLTFMKARFARLYPMYLLGTLLGILVAALAMHYHRGSMDMQPALFRTALPFAIVMLPAPGGLLFPFNEPMWSVFYELLINLVWAILWKPLRSNHVLVGVILLSAAALGFSVASHGDLLHLGTNWAWFVPGLFRVSFPFFTGVLLHRIRDSWMIPSFPPILLLAALPALVFLPLKPGVQLLVDFFILPLFVLAGSQLKPGGRMAVAAHQLGAASYGIYTLHLCLYLLVYAAALRLLGIDLWRYGVWVGIVFMLLLVPLCVLLSRYYEAPARKWIARAWHAAIVPEGVTQAP